MVDEQGEAENRVDDDTMQETYWNRMWLKNGQLQIAICEPMDSQDDLSTELARIPQWLFEMKALDVGYYRSHKEPFQIPLQWVEWDKYDVPGIHKGGVTHGYEKGFLVNSEVEGGGKVGVISIPADKVNLDNLIKVVGQIEGYGAARETPPSRY